MKRLLGILTVILTIGTSLASTSPTMNGTSGNSTATVTQRPTATRSVQVRVKIQKPKLFVGNPHKLPSNVGDWDDDFLDIDDIITSYRRRDITKIEHPEGLSDKVRWRLFLARQLALFKYRQLHS